MGMHLLKDYKLKVLARAILQTWPYLLHHEYYVVYFDGDQCTEIAVKEIKMGREMLLYY